MAGSIDTLDGDLTTSGVNFDNTGGSITAGGVAMNHTGTITIAALLDADTMNVTAGGGTTITSTGRLVGAGGITGGLNNAGDFAPGSSPGIVNIVGAYSQDSVTGVLEIELGGTAVGTEYDQVNITGTAMLAGVLDVTTIDLGGGLFVPSTGNRFDIVTAAGGILGTFGNENLPAGYAWDVDYNTTTLSLEVLALLGDMNGDNNLTSADIPLFVQALVDRATYDLTYAFVNADAAGDVNQNGTFDLGDTGPFSALFGGPASAGTEAVPEPTTLSLAVVLLMGIAIRQRRRV